MARALWTGSLAFGLVNIPVRLYTAVEPRKVRFHEFAAGGERIRHRRVTEGKGEEVPFERVSKGYEVAKGRHVLVSAKELEAVAPEQTRTIEIEQFVRLAEIDPITWDRTYYVGPEDRAGADKAYALLRRAMLETERVAIGRMVLRQRQYLVTVRPFEEALALETMWFADEIRSVSSIEGLQGRVAVRASELGMARDLIERMTSEWDHSRFEDTHRERVLELIERKANGEQVVTAERAPEGAEVIDLLQALRRSLDQASGERAKRASGSKRTPGSRSRPRGRKS